MFGNRNTSPYLSVMKETIIIKEKKIDNSIITVVKFLNKKGYGLCVNGNLKYFRTFKKDILPAFKKFQIKPS